MSRLRGNPKELEAEAEKATLLVAQVDHEGNQAANDTQIVKVVHAADTEVRNTVELQVEADEIPLEVAKINRKGNEKIVVVHKGEKEVRNAADPGAEALKTALKVNGGNQVANTVKMMKVVHIVVDKEIVIAGKKVEVVRIADKEKAKGDPKADNKVGTA